MDDLHRTKPFSIVIPRTIRSDIKQIETETDHHECSSEILGSGMILLRNYLTLNDQVEIVNICQKLGIGPGGFYRPGSRVHLMCLGRIWEPETRYNNYYRSDGAKAPPLLDKFISLIKKIIQDARALVYSEDEIPLMSPDICLANFYTTTGRLGLHQDRSESRHSLYSGLPVVTFSIGDSAEFVYGATQHKTDNVLLESGDVFIFGGESRLIYHGIKTIIPNSAPLPLLKATMLRPGRLSLTFRQY